MTMSRRKMLALAGGGVVLAATASAGATLVRTPQSALEPWRAAGAYSDPRMRALSYAVLAPNPHNRQPWIVDLDTPGQATLYVDTDRLLPHTDPFSRQIVIGLGCFLELMRMAAAEDGYGVSIEVFPDGADAARLDQRPVAVCKFDPAPSAPDPLFTHVFERRSLKEPYDTGRPVADAALDQLASSIAHTTTAGVTNDVETVAQLRELTRAALVIELETPHTYKESVDLFRIGAREVDANPDGIDFSGPQWEALRMTGLFSRRTALNPNGPSFQGGLRMVQENATTAMAYIWLNTAQNTRADQVAAGRDWIRVNLAATALGLGVQPMSQPLQEYPEMRMLYNEVHNMLAPDGSTVQMLGRLGYGPNVAPSPRWGIEQKIRKHA